MFKKYLYPIVHKLSCLTLALSICAGLAAQGELPKVFTLGEYETPYEQLVTQCNSMLLSECGNNMELAYSKWSKMIKDMEAMADELDFDIKGVKVWVNVFWNEDGSIAHIVYYPKPNSRNMDFDELSAFFVNFVNKYSFDQAGEKCFSHYGSASWPTFSKLYQPQEK